MASDLQKKIDRLLQELGPTEPGKVMYISIKHDDNCPALQTQRLIDCTCEPEIERIYS